MYKGFFISIALCVALGANAVNVEPQSDTWVAVDALGRNVATADSGVTRNSIDNECSIGMFYYLWQGQHGAEVKDITKLLNENPDNPHWGALQQFHWGGEPLLGYYKGGDPFIIAKHMQMLMDAGIDYYFFDVTNAVIYADNVKAVMREIDRRQALGLRTPKLAFMTHSDGTNTLKKLYNTFYNDSTYNKYWYLWEGKPLLLANPNDAKGLDKAIKERFTFRYSWAWMNGSGPNDWPWLEFYPQKPGWTKDANGNKVIEQITVGVAQHPSSGIGKSYHDGKEPAVDKYGLCKETPYGLYFAEQWKQAKEIHPRNVMITQWNEWMAMSFQTESANGPMRPGVPKKAGETFFVDVYNQEFCRDLEPSKEPLIQDNYYLQLVSNVRQYRGVHAIPVPTVAKSINLSGEFSQWDEVTPEFNDEPGDCELTSATGQSRASLMRKTNDIVKAKVTKDKDNIYFYVAVAGNDFIPVTSPQATLWMTLLINNDCKYTTGWHGYKYMVTGIGNIMQLKRYDKGKWINITYARFVKRGNEMMLSIPRKVIGLTTDRDFDFKWVDNVPSDKLDVLSFITDGDAAPNGRFNYRYKGSKLLTK
jgi:hypothetical protein